MAVTNRGRCAGVLAAVLLLTQTGASALQPEEPLFRRAGDIITLEFEVPFEYYDKLEDGSWTITGFRVGYFEPDLAMVIHSIDFPVERISLLGETARVSFAFAPLPGDVTQVAFRVQSLTREWPGPWSNPTSIVTVIPRGSGN